MRTTSHQQIRIRNAEPDDLDALAAVWHDSAAGMDGAAFEMPSPRELRERIDRELADGWTLRLAERRGSVVGMLAIKPHEAVLDQIFVLTSEQRSGVGLSLLESAKRSMPQGFTLRMAAANSAASRFYERAGLRIVERGTHPVSGVPVHYFRWDGS